MTQVIKTENPDTSGTNTVLIVLLLAAVVAFFVWFFAQGNFTAPAANEEGINVNIDLPAPGAGGAGGAESAPAQ